MEECAASLALQEPDTAFFKQTLRPFELTESLLLYLDCCSLSSLSSVARNFFWFICSENGFAERQLDQYSHRLYQLWISTPLGKRVTSLQLLKRIQDVSWNSKNCIKQISCGYEHTAKIVNGSVYTFGSGSTGQLGHGTMSNCIHPSRVVEFGESTPPAISVSCGYDHSIVIDSDGKAYGFGSNEFGQLGSAQNIATTPEQIHIRHKVISAETGKHFTALLLDDRKRSVLILGSGLDVDTEPYEGNERYRILAKGGKISPDEKVDKIVAGFSHMLLLTNKGKLFAVGDGTNGKLGTCQLERDGTTSRFVAARTPQLVRFPWAQNQIMSLAAGEQHSAVTTTDGHLYVWGQGRKGQLGVGKFCHCYPMPAKIELPSGDDFATFVSCGKDHTLVATASGKVLGFGSTCYGQAGSQSLFYQVCSPEVVRTGHFKDAYHSIIQVAAGKGHSAVIFNNSELCMFGQKDTCGGISLLSKVSKQRHNCLEPSLVTFS